MNPSLAAGAWLDSVPWQSPDVPCVMCGELISWHERMVKVFGGVAITPLCRSCFDAPPSPDETGGAR